MTHFAPHLRIDKINLDSPTDIDLSVLRLDLVHPVVSGNKWFKLKNYIEEAGLQQKETLLTFGGAYSNHIVATAAAANLAGKQSIGIIRGEEPAQWSHTLLAAQQYGMQLFFISRADYRQKNIPAEVYQQYNQNNIFVIPEGGYGVSGAKGVAQVFADERFNEYSHLITAVGSGTTLAGMVLAARSHQQVIGTPVLKNATSLAGEINNLLPNEKQGRFQLLNHYHFGGYAKYSTALIRFMNSIYQQYALPTDFVYTAKSVFAVFDLMTANYFEKGSKLLFVHTGGLQGNGSLPKGTLIFDA